MPNASQQQRRDASPGLVLAIVCSGVILASLDLFIAYRAASIVIAAIALAAAVVALALPARSRAPTAHAAPRPALAAESAHRTG